MHRLFRFFSLPVALAFAACSDGSPVAIDPLPTLGDQVWYVHASDGQALPALLGHRLLPGNVLEQDFLDSAHVEIGADGSWVHRAWLQRFRNSEFHAALAIQDAGTWTVTTTGYEFRRGTGELLYTVTGPIGTGDWQLNLRYQGQTGVAVSVLRRSRPAAAVEGRYHAQAMNGQLLPQTYILDPAYDNGTEIVSHALIIDSAVVWLRPNQRYDHVIYYSHWEGPAGGTPNRKLIALSHGDYGTWTQTGVQLRLDSGWLENLVILGERHAANVGPLRLNHGITHGDEPANFRYVRE